MNWKRTYLFPNELEKDIVPFPNELEKDIPFPKWIGKGHTFPQMNWKSHFGKLDRGVIIFPRGCDAGEKKIPVWFWLEILHLDNSRFYETPFSKLHHISLQF
jgi:hypothetical protein